MSLSFVKKIKFAEWPSYSFGLPSLQAHRGYWKPAGLVENTRQSFLEAKKNGHMVECDVRLTKDLVPVVYHDEGLLRLAGVDLKVEDLNLSEFQMHCPDSPTLEELLVSSDYPEYWNIELKTLSLLGTPLERKVAEVVNRSMAMDRVMFSSFNPLALWRLQGFLPAVPRAFLISDENINWIGFSLAIKLHMLNIDEALLDIETLEMLHFNQVPVSAWTVNDSERQKHLLSHGVKSIITDF